MGLVSEKLFRGLIRKQPSSLRKMKESATAVVTLNRKKPLMPRTCHLLLTALKELQEIFCTSEGVNKDYLVSWLLDANSDRISKLEIQSTIHKRPTFVKGEMYENERLEHSWRPTHLRQLISLKLKVIKFKIIRSKKFSATARQLKVSNVGEEFLSNPSDLLVFSPSIDLFKSTKKALLGKT